MARPVAGDLNDEPEDDAELPGPNDGEDDADGTEDDSEGGEGEGDDDGVDAAPEEPAPRQRRAARPEEPDRFSALEARVEAAERVAREAEARLAARESAAPVETPEQEAAKLALMTPEQIIDYKVDKALGRFKQTNERAQVATANAADKASFDTLIMGNQTFRKLAGEVERRHSEMMRAGTYPKREVVLMYLLGERALKMAQESGKQNTERERRVARQTTRPASPGGDVRVERRGGKTMEQRLENIPL